jgi:hypothetical protein
VATNVEVGTVRGFTLDDPVRGVLDNTEWTLAGVVFIDITECVANVSIKRGKNRDLDKYSAGTLGVSLHNEDRFFDPVVGTAIDTVPRVALRVTVDGTAQFTGTANDWAYSYDTSGASKVDLTGVDDFQLLALQQTLPTGTPPLESTGARVNRVLDMFTVNWPEDKRQIDVGAITVCPSDFDGENALEYLQLIEKSEQGQLFIGKTGDLVFRSRDASAARSDNLVLFSDNGLGVPFIDADLNFGSEFLYNRVIVEAPGFTATADNFRSQQQYGILTLELNTLGSSEAAIQTIADYLVAKYGEPELRFETLTVNLDTLTESQRAAVLTMELGDVAEIQFTPNGQGPEIDKYGQVIAVSHSVSPSRHDVTFSFDSLDFTAFVLDDLVFGTLDIRQLGF